MKGLEERTIKRALNLVARYAAIVQLAAFEAVNSITSDYQPLSRNDRCAAWCVARSRRSGCL
jgi:hypothetical protein